VVCELTDDGEGAGIVDPGALTAFSVRSPVASAPMLRFAPTGGRPPGRPSRRKSIETTR
jgi:hypothetical protein